MKTLLPFSLLTAFLFTQFTSYAQAQYVIPVVVHVLHTGGPENISDAQVYDAIKNLNDDYNKRNADTAAVIPEFSNNIANMQVEFRLAKLDPNGNCTNGIEHIYSNQTDQGQSHFSKINQWPPNRYLNIWVYRKIGGVGAVTIAPFSPNYTPARDGITILHDYLGSIGTANSMVKHTLTYLTGSYLGLLNISGGVEQDCGEDSVSDTPPTNFIISCSPTMLSCDGVTRSNVQNFMTYSYCSSMFTNGQKTRLHNNLNTYANRNTLHTQANLIATGTSSNTPSQCAPVADYTVGRNFLCVGDSVKFADVSYNGEVTSRQWQFSNANISSSSDSVVYVKFNTTGWQQVSLTVSNTYGSNAVTKQLVYVSPAQNIAVPYHNSFEDANEVAAYWPAYNYDNDQPQFTRNNTVALTGGSCIMLNNKLSNLVRNYDELVSPSFDLSGLTNGNAKMYFWYSYATSDTSSIQVKPDSLVVYASKNCGQSWSKIFVLGGDNTLLNAGYVSDYFAPNGAAYWKQAVVPIPGVSSISNFRVAGVNFKIRVYGSNKSNNFYLDDFAIGAEPTVGIEEANALAGISLMPNPFTNKFEINNIPEGEYDLYISNLQGQVVLQQKVTSQVSRDTVADMHDKPTGTYLVSIANDKTKVTLKVVKE